jgi:AcrR family transcriptional regulator
MTRAVLREQQREATRTRIIDAVHAVLAEESPTSLSVPSVAARAGTSLRTVYRYFPTKEALVDAASRTFEADADGTTAVPTLATLADYLADRWRLFSTSIASVRAQHLTPAGRELRAIRLPRFRRFTRGALVELGLDLPEEDLDRLADLVVALTSSSMYLELVDRLGYDEDTAGELAAWVTRAAIERAQTEGRVAR